MDAIDGRRHRAEIAQYKLSIGCADCGYSAHAVALQFDHRPGEVKLGGVGALAGKKGKAVVWAEIAKCDVRCANCHAVKTEERRREAL